MFIPALFIIGKNWKQLKVYQLEEWASKLWYIHIITYCFSTKE